MSDWTAILAGVDAHEEGAWAATTAWRLAQRSGAACYLVHAIPPVWPVGAAGPADTVDVGGLRDEVFQKVRERLEQALAARVPAEALEHLQLQTGRPARVLHDTALKVRADLVVLGARYHSALARWLGGSTLLAAARTLDVPLLAATPSSARIERILAAVDLSEAAGPTIAVAERYARLFGAALRVVHVVETLVFSSDMTYPTRLEPAAAAVLEREVWPLLTLPTAEHVIRHGTAREALATEAAEWGADLLVVGSHGRGWIDRTLLGSVTAALLKDLPVSVLVVPAGQPKALGGDVAVVEEAEFVAKA